MTSGKPSDFSVCRTISVPVAASRKNPSVRVTTCMRVALSLIGSSWISMLRAMALPRRTSVPRSPACSDSRRIPMFDIAASAAARTSAWARVKVR